MSEIEKDNFNRNVTFRSLFAVFFPSSKPLNILATKKKEKSSTKRDFFVICINPVISKISFREKCLIKVPGNLSERMKGC